MKTLEVNLGERSYPIYIGSSLLDSPAIVYPHIKSRQVLIVTNDTVAPLYLEKAKACFTGFDVDVVVLPDGEEYKTLGTVGKIFDELLVRRHNRNTTLVALGGGVIGDMTGFAAACYQRGVSFIQVPTTLLAQVDSSVGGKTGVNHPLGKNMIGAFYQPSCVVIDVNTLQTLPDREYRSGIAEVIKYGLINDEVFFSWLEENMEKIIARDELSLINAIESSCFNKAAVVAEDEKETGIRAILNLGHTFGHAIEAWGEYKCVLHGEAVAIGTVMAAELSCRMGLLQPEENSRLRALYIKAGLPVKPPLEMDSVLYIDFMMRDKKVLGDRIRLVLLASIGKALLSEEATTDQILSVIDYCRLS